MIQAIQDRWEKNLHLGFSRCFIFLYTIVFYEPIQKMGEGFYERLSFDLQVVHYLYLDLAFELGKVTALSLRKLMAEPDNA